MHQLPLPRIGVSWFSQANKTWKRFCQKRDSLDMFSLCFLNMLYVYAFQEGTRPSSTGELRCWNLCCLAFHEHQRRILYHNCTSQSCRPPDSLLSLKDPLFREREKRKITGHTGHLFLCYKAAHELVFGTMVLGLGELVTVHPPTHKWLSIWSTLMAHFHT